MPLSVSDIRALEPKANRFRIFIGDALHIEVYPNVVSILYGDIAFYLEGMV